METEITRMAQESLRLVCASLPHLAGLAYLARVTVDSRVATAGVFASGRIVVNPEFFSKLSRAERVFVMGHELLHLALQSHIRGGGSDRHLFNVAHDYIINDMLTAEGAGAMPRGGLYFEGAQKHSAEVIVRDLQNGRRIKPGGAETAVGRAFARAGLAPSPQNVDGLTGGSDVLSDTLERKLFPEDSRDQAVRARSIAKAAAKVESLRAAEQILGGPGGVSGESSTAVEALRKMYQTPWHLGLHKWMEAVSPGTRTYARPSRRGDLEEAVRPGRGREGWTLSIILDTSGSMYGEFPPVLGAIQSFAEGANVAMVRIIQCDTEVTCDETVEPSKLSNYVINGMGGSDLTAGIEYLEKDPEVTAVAVITDGFIDYPLAPPAFAVLWIVTGSSSHFKPEYGAVIELDTRS